MSLYSLEWEESTNIVYSCPKCGHFRWSFIFSWVLNISKERDSMTSQDNLWQSLKIFMIIFFFNISSEFFLLQQLISSVSTFSLVHQRMIQGKENAAASLCDPTVNLYLRHQSEGVKSGGTFCGSELQKQNIFHFLTAFFFHKSSHLYL